ncbi:MAG: fibrinogen-like YCDxxxxGGGW domain-containing protein [Polyangiaceae bacterium]
MRAMPGIRPSYFFLAAASIAGSGCLLNADAFGGGGSPSTTTSSSTTTTTSTSDTSGGGGTGGTTASGGTGGTTSSGGTGGTTVTGGGGTGGVTDQFPTACRFSPTWNSKQSGVVTIQPAGAPAPIDVYCDQVNMGGGWALVYSSVADPAQGQTTKFWKIDKADSLKIKAPGGDPTPTQNYYAGVLYNYGTEYRDDITDVNGYTAYGVLHTFANGINPSTMRFISPSKAADNMSDNIYRGVFNGGWSSWDFDGDDEAGQNDAAYFSNVSQHYAYTMYWGYNLGSDQDNAVAGMVPPDFTDGGIGPHVSNIAITEANAALTIAAKPTLALDGIPGAASRVNRIARWARW